VRGISTNTKVEDIKAYLLKEKILITNAIRIRNSKGPVPLIRLFTKDPTLVSKLITNGITIGFTRFNVEESFNNARPYPCTIC